MSETLQAERVQAIIRLDCAECDGTGGIRIPVAWTTCATCEGTGYETILILAANQRS